MKELNSDLKRMQGQYDAKIEEIEKIDQLLAIQLKTRRENRKELIAEYWAWLDKVYESNFGDIRQAIVSMLWRDAFNDPPPIGVEGLHDPYNYMESVKQRLNGHRVTMQGDCESLKTKIAGVQAQIVSIKGGRPVSRIVWVLIGAIAGAALATLARLLIQ